MCRRRKGGRCTKGTAGNLGKVIISVYIFEPLLTYSYKA